LANPRLSEVAHPVLVAGGGMAGLAAALVTARAGHPVELLEQAAAFSEVGAGIQLGPNAVRVLADWGLWPAVRQVAAFPEQLCARDARSGHALGVLPLGARVLERYGQPYVTVHRADLHALLLQEVLAQGRVRCHLNTRLAGWVQSHAEWGGRDDATGVSLHTESGERWQGSALLGCDGVWSRVRQGLLNDGAPTFSGHLAYRGLVPMADLPQAVRAMRVTVWLGPRMHAVHYPVRAGAYMNVVVVVQGAAPVDLASWDHAANAQTLQRALGPVAADLDRVLQAVPQWRLWPLNDREPMGGPHEHAQGLVALLGDAAHPLRPYLAQGAAMALEDAWVLGVLLRSEPGATGGTDWSHLLQHWARLRWQRNAWVQARSRRNGQIFHAQGPLRWGRNWAMAVWGKRVMDLPDLYAGPPKPPVLR
jgi:salicylate hydroxylase